MTSPSVTFVIPTLNSARTLGSCLASIREQEYPGEIEVVLVDGGSTDETLEIARRFDVDRVLDNPLETGEAGKARGVREARGEILAFVDSDNILVGREWLVRMTAPFAEERIVSSEALRWAYTREDGYVDRYCALAGVNDPVSLFVGNYGRYSHLTGRWTGFQVSEQQADGYVRVHVDPEVLPTMGANGYLVRAGTLRSVLRGDYLFDIDSVRELALHGFDLVARVDVPIRHLYASGFRDFAKKTRRRARDYLYYRRRGMRSYPWGAYRSGLVRFSVATVATVPLFLQAAAGYRAKPDRAWLFHPVACWTTLVIYGVETIRGRMRSERLSRRGWRQ
jgi:glycosyltransferase involved in cell wall biosynthesis